MTRKLRGLTTRVAFVITISLNAFLLFLMEPLFGKMALPHVGGNAAVWTTCMLFYQAALVGGYLYAHALARIVLPRVQALVHVGLLLAAMATLPVHIPENWAPSNVAHPELSLGWLLIVRLSAPFLLLAAGSPLIQHWSAIADSSGDRDPYSLYAASNIGSFAALMAYPTFFEVWFGLRAQASIWSVGYALLLLSIAGCAVSMVRGSAVVARSRDAEPQPVSFSDKVQWLLLAAAPSSLLLGVTTHITTDLVPVPLLWVLPLALYLATFVIAFGRRSGRRMSKILDTTLPYLVLALAVLLFLHAELPGASGYAAHLIVFFACALACHVRLARQRPATQQLTEFYLWISIGGALGGVFNVVVAPNVFHAVAEYPIALVAAAALARPIRSPRWSDVGVPGLLFLVYIGALALARGFSEQEQRLFVSALLCTGGVAAFAFRQRPLRFALAVGAIVASGAFTPDASGRQEFVGRSFYGVYRVVLVDSERTRRFYSGTTIHGSESVNDLGTTPLTYYHRDGPLGTLFDHVRPPNARWRVGVIGLGVGSTAAYAREGEQWSFFEIDPLVASIAEDSRYFRFLSSAKARPRVVLGDARLSLAAEPASRLDLLLVDAFSSDAIPIHLITREALALYRSRLAPDGMIAWHISNRSLDLRPVLAALARDAGLDVAICDDTRIPADSRGRFPSIWVLMGSSAQVRRAAATDARWSALSVSSPKLWTDDFSNILGVLR